MATAQQGQVVCLHCVVAKGHVSREIAEVRRLHKPFPSCRKRTGTQSETAPCGAQHLSRKERNSELQGPSAETSRE